MHGIIVATIARLFDEHVDHELVLKARDGVWPEAAWQALAELGLPLAMVDEAAGGIGLSAGEAFDLVRLAGAARLPLPLGETMVTRWLAGRLGLDVPDGPLTFATAAPDAGFWLRQEAGRPWIAGRVRRVPSARHADAVLVQADRDGQPAWLLLRRDRFTITPATNLAGEPRDDLAIDGPVDADGVSGAEFAGDGLVAIGAALRCAGLAGAIEQVLAITTAYANERVQFGKPIGRQQAIQHALAQLAGEAAAARAAATMAAAAVTGSGVAILPIAAAKARIGEAAGKVAAIAHQVHGAIGFTREHRLHDLTTRLWAWRDEYGNERHWHIVLGQAALAAGAEGYWPFVTGLADAAEKGALS